MAHHIKTYLLLPWLLAGCLLAWATEAPAASPVANLHERYTSEHPLVVACDWAFAPFEYRADDGEPAGFNVEVVSTILDKLQIPHVYKMQRREQGLRMFEEHKADLVIMPISRNWGSNYFFSQQSIMTYRQKVVYRKETAPLEKLSQLKPTDRLVMKRKDYASSVIDTTALSTQQLFYSSPLEAMKGIVSGKYTYFIWGEEPLRTLMRKYKMTGLQINDIDIPDGNIKFVCYDEELLKVLNDEFEQLDLSGKVNEMKGKWFYNEQRTHTQSPVALMIALGITVMAIILFTINHIVLSRSRKKKKDAQFADKMLSQAAGQATTHSSYADGLAQQRENEEAMERYRLIFEESLVGMSFYSPEGYLIDSNRRLREICHFESVDDPFWYSLNLFDSHPFQGNVDRNNIEEFYVCTQTDIPERGVHQYLEIRLYPIRDENGELVYISIAIRDITDERTMYMQRKLNDDQIRQANKEISRYENELRYLLESSQMRVWRSSTEKREVEFFKDLHNYEMKMTFDEFFNHIIDDENHTVAYMYEHLDEVFSKPFTTTHAVKNLIEKDDAIHWYAMNSIPRFDDNGKRIGCFGLIRNVTSLMQAQERLKEETARANESGHMKSVFLANMTHEIRTPLNAIVGFSDVLQAIEAPEDKKEVTRVIRNNCDMLLRLIDDILAISNIDTGGLKLIPRDVDFAVAFNDICQTLAQRVQEPGVQFIKDNPYSSCTTCLDKGRIQQVVTNFVTNAVKYTHQGHIKVGYRIEEREGKGSGLYIYCEDTGAGIPKEKQHSVFERFVKLNSYIQGTGLGLSICKAIANSAGGDIGVYSEGEGTGSTFWIWVPCQFSNVSA